MYEKNHDKLSRTEIKISFIIMSKKIIKFIKIAENVENLLKLTKNVVKFIENVTKNH